MNERDREQADKELNETITVSRNDVLNVIMDMMKDESTPLADLHKASPLSTVIVPMIALDVFKKLEERARMKTVADILTGANKED